MRQETTEETSRAGIIRTMLIFGAVAFVVFGLVYLTLWKRARAREGEDVESDQTDGDEGADTEDDEENSPDSSTEDGPRRKFVHARVQRESRPGDPIYDRLIVGGTASLGVILCIGATIVLVVSLVDRSKYDGAKEDDFRSLGSNGCRIESAARYGFYDVRKNNLNFWCVEAWEYNVEVVGSNTTFESASQSSEDCRNTCEACVGRGQLYGEDYYVGFDPLRPGIPITNETYVECFEPTVPVESLSDFYNCGRQLPDNATCYMLEDTASILDEDMESVELGLAATYACYGVGALLVLLAVFFVHRNKRVLEKSESQQAEQQQNHEKLDERGEAQENDSEREEQSKQLDSDEGKEGE